MEKIIKNKRDLKLVTSRSSGYKTSLEKFLYLLLLPNQVWWCNIKCFFLVIPKIISANLYKPIHGIINFSTSICHFESAKCRKEGKNYHNLNIWRTKRAFMMEWKTFFMVFEKLSFGIADTSFKLPGSSTVSSLVTIHLASGKCTN